MQIKTIAGLVDISIAGETAWELHAETYTPEENVELLALKLRHSTAAILPVVVLHWNLPQHDIHYRWHSSCGFNRFLPADWSASLDSSLASHTPVLALAGSSGANRLTWACSEALRPVKFKAGICEESCEVSCEIQLFTQVEAPLESYETLIRFDRRGTSFAEAVRSASKWLESFPQYRPLAVPETAFAPFYSSWYSFHQNLSAGEIEQECRLAAELGMQGFILDDGWQTDDNHRGYAFCGDWEISRRRFPDMAAHVAAIHQLGMKYLVWFSVPFVGFKSRAAQLFQGKFLGRNDRRQCYNLDPRFPEVREYLISTYEKALRDWDIDGFKFDFINQFCFNGEDPAVAENYAGRDVKSLPLAVDKLLSSATERLSKIKPGLLIEFRQSYIGPAVRKYGNLFRAADCPGDAVSNRKRTIDLRLTSGNSAVHSDMLEWHAAAPVEDAARQLLAIVFAVPQISVKLETLTAEHRQMLKFYLDFMTSHRETLLRGELVLQGLGENYPQLAAAGKNETIIAVYAENQVVELPPAGNCFILNATASSALVVNSPHSAATCKYSPCGERQPGEKISAGLSKIFVPVSDILQISFE